MPISDHVDVRQSGTAGSGLFAKADLEPGTPVLWLTTGERYTEARLHELDITTRRKMFQVEGGWLLTSDGPEFINHSCAANCGWADDATLVTMAPVKQGAEVTFDYSTSDTALIWRDKWRCACGTAACRGYQTGRDSLHPAFQARYAGYLPSWTEAFIARNSGWRRWASGAAYAAAEAVRRLRGD